MIQVNHRECNRCAVDAQLIAKKAKALLKIMKELDEVGVHLFGGSSLQLRFAEGRENDYILATVTDYFVDGGDGSTREDKDGYLRGEGVEDIW